MQTQNKRKWSGYVNIPGNHIKDFGMFYRVHSDGHSIRTSSWIMLSMYEQDPSSGKSLAPSYII